MKKRFLLSLLTMVYLLMTLLLPSNAEAKDPAFPSCNGIDINDPYATINTQVSPTPTPALIVLLGSTITGSMTYATVVKNDLTVRTL
ncbi:hypothetical protein AB4Z22_39165, partial [Paenibacillus sp. TAF58]